MSQLSNDADGVSVSPMPVVSDSPTSILVDNSGDAASPNRKSKIAKRDRKISFIDEPSSSSVSSPPAHIDADTPSIDLRSDSHSSLSPRSTLSSSSISSPSAVVGSTAKAYAHRSSVSPIPLSRSTTWLAFKASIPHRRVWIDGKQWSYYDIGGAGNTAKSAFIATPSSSSLPSSSSFSSPVDDAFASHADDASRPSSIFDDDTDIQPLLLLPGTSCTCAAFFHQSMELGNKGYRVISASPPAFANHEDWCRGLNKFIVALGLGGKSKQQPEIEKEDDEDETSSASSTSTTTEESSTSTTTDESATSASAAESSSSSVTASPSPSSSSSSSTTLSLGKLHVLANGLAGFLMLYYLSHMPVADNYVSSLILCNSFADTLHYQSRNSSSPLLHTLIRNSPRFLLRTFIADSLPEESEHPRALEFVLDQMQTLEADVLASRLLLNIMKHKPMIGDEKPSASEVVTADATTEAMPEWPAPALTTDIDAHIEAVPDPISASPIVTSPLPSSSSYGPLPQSRITILDTQDESHLQFETRQRLYDRLPNAKYALLKAGGDFPFLSVSDDVNMHIQVHLRRNGVYPAILEKKARNSISTGARSIPSSSPSSDSYTSLSSSLPTNSPSSSPVPRPHYFLQPSQSHVSLGKSARPAFGFGLPRDEDDSDSIFCTSNGSGSAPKASSLKISATASQWEQAAADSNAITQRLDADRHRTAEERVAEERRGRSEKDAEDRRRIKEEEKQTERQNRALGLLLEPKKKHAMIGGEVELEDGKSDEDSNNMF